MSEIDRICRQMKRAFEGGAWHGPALLEILRGVDARVASAAPVGDAHRIWEIVLHLYGTQRLLLRRLRGDPTELSAEEDWPPIPEATDSAWREMVKTLTRAEKELRAAVAAFPESRLDQPLVAGGSSAYETFHGHVQHTLYHAAQILILTRAARAGGE